MRHLAFAIAFGLAALTGCESSDDNNGNNGGPLTQCDLSYDQSNPQGKGFGEGCANDNECEFGECLVPGTGGNITNAQFGFCTRGCDCENSEAAKLTTDQKEELECLYPSGFKDFHHVVVECANVAECQQLDPRWSDCKLPDTGGVRKVCHAL